MVITFFFKIKTSLLIILADINIFRPRLTVLIGGGGAAGILFCPRVKFSKKTPPQAGEKLLRPLRAQHLPSLSKS
jgi:hypothetical protein